MFLLSLLCSDSLQFNQCAVCLSCIQLDCFTYDIFSQGILIYILNSFTNLYFLHLKNHE